ncbi:hypothetical protein AU255_15185 [Methyloprofundus sedimenti]|uniref:Bcr/CflA family efflux transporter n=1 Tax=Methyloprofundus sedimenti TaxID=1420851 RepID=A0A1V8M1X8_9GAMM|nr:multidrug effflux MFS transporter [Methyloprofundus sedimenti]OQK15567.1 hypothetical protein AU255_15185 [Methyloprofundus sedimenti]
MIRIVILLAFLAAFAPVSTDMYLPAIPDLEASWHEPLTYINLALSGFFVAFCLSILMFGPLSDHFGRKKPLLVGIAIYCVASILCATANDLDHFVIYRMLQGFGAGSASAISLAIAKDRFTDAVQRGQVLSYIAVIMAIAPMAAPTMGAVLLQVSDWRMIFIVQFLFGLFLWCMVAAMKESLLTKEAISTGEVISRYFSFLSKRIFLSYCVISSLLLAPLFAFIAVSSTIYQETMKLGAVEYGLLFAFNALSIMLGNLVYLKLQKKMGDRKLIILAITVAMTGACIQLLLSSFHHILAFALPMFIITFGVGIGRAPSVNSALEQINQHTGIASSIIVFSNFFIASIAMLIASIEMENRIALIAILALCASSVNAMLMFGLHCYRIAQKI